ncbi:hypothetical protein LZ496_05375 [Sphingomonas sp. NSE70-1]|uniref:Beta-barrel assembly machine subunit BamE n=1 Tax=Sphingomonas caseinilyticus TaxID=2908205 RepID=A0ABT0RT85_9SPHN|nr:hypothetical protein [Sphingomonas caseinilyticus]MCL6698212.1 hypothetical protein [Sphingomonas caseinilyticus]
MKFASFAAVAAFAMLAGCTTIDSSRSDFLSGFGSLCGQAYEGRIVSPPVAADEAFAGKPLVMHVVTCTADTVRIPFHVGDDHSRTWVLTRTATGLRLKHDHRHRDGSEDRVTQYGGDATTPVDAERQIFPADDFTKDLLRREGNIAGVDNVWAVEHRPGQFAYELRRPGRFFRVEFDLSRPVATPPAAWGSE